MQVPWREVYQVLSENTPDPLALLRSDSEVPDEAEVERSLGALLPQVYAAGFRRVLFEFANEPNNHAGTTPAEITALIPGWLRCQARHPNVGFISPPMMPDSESNLRPWHPPEFAQFILGQHTYDDGSLFWSPWNLGHFYPGKGQFVTEFNSTHQEGRTNRNLGWLKWMATLPYVQGICYFCGPNNHPQFQSYAITEDEARIYGAWWTEYRGGIMPWENTLPHAYQQFAAEGGTAEAFESIIQTWVNAGGDPEESALRYLVGTRRLKATQARLEKLSGAGKAAFQELNDAVQPYLPPL